MQAISVRKVSFNYRRSYLKPVLSERNYFGSIVFLTET